MNEQEKEAVVRRFIRSGRTTRLFQFEPGEWSVGLNLFHAQKTREKFPSTVAGFGSQVIGLAFIDGFDTSCPSKRKAERLRYKISKVNRSMSMTMKEASDDKYVV